MGGMQVCLCEPILPVDECVCMYASTSTFPICLRMGTRGHAWVPSCEHMCGPRGQIQDFRVSFGTRSLALLLFHTGAILSAHAHRLLVFLFFFFSSRGSFVLHAYHFQRENSLHLKEEMKVV